MNVWKADPSFTNFVPNTAVEAVDRFTRCTRNGLRPMLVPECLIACARGLRGEELDRFEAWMINPSGDLAGIEIVEQTAICDANNKVFNEIAERVERQANGDELPPVPAFEGPSQEEDEKMPPMPALVRQVAGDFRVDSPRVVREVLADVLDDITRIVVTEPEIPDPPPSSPRTLPASSSAGLCPPSSTSG
jgi:hypothetical protein